MCGIVGYVGERSAEEVVISGLRRLEYRGYDSAGIALVLDGTIVSAKKAGKLANLDAELDAHPLPFANTGIGHTSLVYMIESQLRGVNFICANTDMQALKHSKAEYKIGKDLKPVVLTFQVGPPQGDRPPDLISVTVSSSSGYAELDEAVVFGFRQAAFFNDGKDLVTGKFTYWFQ